MHNSKPKRKYEGSYDECNQNSRMESERYSLLYALDRDRETPF